MAGRSKNARGLTAMQQDFCYEYVNDPECNATQAAIRAKFSPKSAHVKASQMLDMPAVQKEIDRLNKAAAYKIGLTSATVLRGVKRLAEANMCDYGYITAEGDFVIDLKTTTREQMEAVQEMITDTWTEGKGDDKTVHRRTRLKLVPKLAAWEMLGRKTNAFPQKHEHTGEGGGPIHFTVEIIGQGKKPVKPAKAS
jgi:phage terminase small subunit